MDASTRALMNSVAIVLIGSAMTFLAAWFWFRKNAAVAEAKRLADEHALLAKRVVDLESQLSSVKQAVQPISAAFQAILIKELTHFHTPELDELMTRVGPPSTLTAEEETRMEQLLAERATELNGDIDSFERDAAVMLPMVLKRTKREITTVEEQRRVGDPVELAVVTVLVPQEEAKEGSEESLRKIEENTAKTAESLAALNQRATDKLAAATQNKAQERRNE